MPPVVRTAFGPLLARDLRKVYYETGKERPLEYPMVANMDTMGWNPVKDQQVAGIGTMPEKPEGQQFALDEHIIGNAKEYIAVPYGMAIEFTWEGWRDELYGVAREMVAEQSRATRQRQEVEFWDIFNNAFTAGSAVDNDPLRGFTDSEALITTSHTGLDATTRSNRPSPDVGLSITGVQSAVLRFETMTTERNVPRLMAPVMVVIHANQKFTAREVLGSSGRPYTADNELNALIEEDLSWMVSHYLSSQTAWFMLAAKGVHDLNFLWRDQPIFDSFDDPWSKNAVFTSYQRFAVGWGAWRGIDGSTG